MLEKLDIKEWLALNAKLQQKKNNLRGLLKEKGILKKEGNNTFDKYKYFTEAQYKELFTELLSKCSLELKFTELAYDTFEGSEKQSNGRMPKLEFSLFDCETGFYEKTVITGEGIDKGDKAGYKAYTGALKYYLADTFMVATGDDPEEESPNEKMNNKIKNEPQKVVKNQFSSNKEVNNNTVDEKPKMTGKQATIIFGLSDEIKQWACTKFKLNNIGELSPTQADWIIKKLEEREKNNESNN